MRINVYMKFNTYNQRDTAELINFEYWPMTILVEVRIIEILQQKQIILGFFYSFVNHFWFYNMIQFEIIWLWW